MDEANGPTKDINAEPPQPSRSGTDGGALPTPDADATLDAALAAGSPAEGIATETGLIGPYRLLKKLGEGGMGQVWLAEQTAPVHRQVALKLIKASMYDSSMLHRFQSERQSLAIMDHPSIAKVFDTGATPEGQPYFVMEYVRGLPITSYCDQEHLKIRERLELFIKVCEGIQHAHQKAVIHRDLKPANILVVEVDGKPTPRIIDFGLAKLTSPLLAGESMFTQVGGFVGTPAYMSPEQADPGVPDVDTRTDVYSLGVVLYILLTGSLPFDTKQWQKQPLHEVLRQLREGDPPRPSTKIGMERNSSIVTAEMYGTEPQHLVSLLRGDLDCITMKAIEKDRARRYGTPSELAADIVRYLHNEPIVARPASTAYRVKKYVLRHRIAVAFAASVALLLVAFAVTMAVQAVRIARERDRANREAASAKQVSDFLAGLFKMSDPSEARGITLTAREILAKGAREIRQSLRDQPDLKARLESIIGDVYTNLGMYGEAELLLQDALESQRGTLGLDNAETLTTMNRLANLNWYEGKFGDAEPLYREVIERRRRILGEEHPDTLRVNFDLASLYLLQKRYDEMERLALKTLEVQRRVLGSEHPDTLSSLNNLQSLYYRQGRFAQAEPIAVEVLKARRRGLGENHPHTILSLHNLATIYAAMGRYDQAEPLFLKAIDARRRILGENHPYTCHSLWELSGMYQKQGRYQEAESAALAAYQGFVRTLGAQHADTRAIANYLSKLYAAWEKPKQAAEWQAKLPHESERKAATR